MRQGAYKSEADLKAIREEPPLGLLVAFHRQSGNHLFHRALQSWQTRVEAISNFATVRQRETISKMRKAVSKAIRQARAEAIEEAAQKCEAAKRETNGPTQIKERRSTK